MTAADEPRPIDLLVHGAAELATPLGDRARTGAELDRLHVERGAAVAVDGGRIAAVGGEAELERRFRPRVRLDAGGGLLLPGFVDAHTHPVFEGTREDECEQRTRGATYVEIAESGGGILSSVRGVRGASEERLVAGLLARLDRFLEAGTTTVEAKSGYGLSLDDELKCLRAIRAADRSHPVDLVPTFLGAHDFPPEFRERRSEYVALVADEMLPAVAEGGLAEYCDVFTEGHVFGLEDSRRILERARSLGLGLRLHVDQLTPLGGAELAADLGAAERRPPRVRLRRRHRSARRRRRGARPVPARPAVPARRARGAGRAAWFPRDSRPRSRRTTTRAPVRCSR